MLTVNPNTSVHYLVARRMNEWFCARALDKAKGVIFVHDPKLVKQFHCERCRIRFDEDIKEKYDISGRQWNQQKLDEKASLWREVVATFADLTEPTEKREAAGELEDKFFECFSGANVVTQGLHNAFVQWVHHYTIEVENARALKGKGVKFTTKTKTKATAAGVDKSLWPDICCVNSPVEADDQLGYLYRCGVVDIVLTVDSDFIPIGCYDVITKGIFGNNKTTPSGYTQDSIFKRAKYIFNTDNHVWTKIANKREAVARLFCLLSCVVGNDYVLGARSPTDAIAFFRKLQPTVCDDTLVKSVAKSTWDAVVANRRKKKVVARYSGDGSDYMNAFVRSFNIYAVGRVWKFSGLAPTWEDFLLKRFDLKSWGVSSDCEGHTIQKELFFVKVDVAVEPRMMLEIDFQAFPPEGLPSCVLEWWLLCRGCECEEDIARHHLVLQVANFRRWGTVLSPQDYKTTFSSTLHALLGTSPRIPLVKWCHAPATWTASSKHEPFDQVRDALSNCALHNDCGDLVTKKELQKATRMNHDGQVYWRDLTLRQGRTLVSHNERKVIQFVLQCLASMKSAKYEVEIVFVEHHRGNGGSFQIDHRLSYCTCKRGAIATTLCSHRRAVLFWLRTLKKKWDQAHSIAPNFREFVQELKVPCDTLSASQLPLSVGQIIKIHEAASLEKGKKKRRWSAVNEEAVKTANKQYLEDTNETLALKIFRRLSEAHSKGDLDVRNYRQIGMLGHVVNKYHTDQ